MLDYKMPLAWSNNSLAHKLDQMVTNYRFHWVPNKAICEFPDYRYSANSRDELANLLVSDGLQDGTVQVWCEQDGLFERHESVCGMAARFRTQAQRNWLNLPPDRLALLFARSGRRLRPDVGAWWSDTLGKESRPWRLRRYVFSKGMFSARKKVEEVLEFRSDADMMAFKLRWS